MCTILSDVVWSMFVMKYFFTRAEIFLAFSVVQCFIKRKGTQQKMKSVQWLIYALRGFVIIYRDACLEAENISHFIRYVIRSSFYHQIPSSKHIFSTKVTWSSWTPFCKDISQTIIGISSLKCYVLTRYSLIIPNL